MKIRQWLGYNEDASQYLLRPGELRVLHNLQSRRPGMLISRPGIKKIYGSYDDEVIHGLYRRSTILGSPSDFVWLQKALVERDLGIEELDQSVWPFKYIWTVKRIKDNESRVIDTLELAPHGTEIKNFCIAEDRHGRMFIFYGHGVTPRLYRPHSLANNALTLGLEAPTAKPKITPTGDGFFIEAVDIDFRGGGYNTPPDLTVEGEALRSAKLKSIIQRGSIVGVEVIDGGSGYAEPPEITVATTDIGSGFRAIGIRSTSATNIVGWDDTDPGVVSGTAPTTLEAYGDKDGTANQKIAYQTETFQSTTRLTGWDYQWNFTGTFTPDAGIIIPMHTVKGLAPGNVVRTVAYYANGSYYYAWPSRTILTVDEVNKTVTLNAPAFTNNGQIAYATTHIYTFVVQNDQVEHSPGIGEPVGLQVANSSDVNVGDLVQFSPDLNCVPTASLAYPTATHNPQIANYTSFNAANAKVTAVDTDKNLIFVDKVIHIGAGYTSNNFNTATNTPPRAVIEVVTTNEGTGFASADYNEISRRYTAMIPLTSSNANGAGAHAMVEFSPLPLGYAVNTSDESSQGVTDTGLDKHFNTISLRGGKWQTQTTLSKYLYGEYWGGSDFDRAKSAENSRYGGLQASGSSFIHGFSGTTGGKTADVYWPDYSNISVWFNTGVESSAASQWTRFDVPVQTDEGGARYIEFDLKPSRNAKKITSAGGFGRQTSYEDATELPESVAPKVRLNLVDCPDSWVISGNECLPTSVKEAEPNHLPWWSASSGVPRPIVDLQRNADGEIETTAMQIINPGSGWGKNTRFAFRIYQANAYQQIPDYNTSVTERTLNRGHSRYSSTDRYAEFRVRTDVADANSPHGPPHTIVSPTIVGIQGDGYNASDTGTVVLKKRNIDTGVYSAGETLSFTAVTLRELSSSTLNNITSVTIYNKGRNYKSKPDISVRNPGNGYGLKVEPVIKNGRIDSVTIIDGGRGYNVTPELYTESRSSKLSPVMRPAMRGTYRCAYRFVDRSEQVIGTITATLGESATTLTVSDASLLKAGMMLESTRLPDFTYITGVINDQVEINQEIEDLPESYRVYWRTPTQQDNSMGKVILGSATTTESFTLPSGSAYYSPNNEYKLCMEEQGDLVLYKKRQFVDGWDDMAGTYRYITVYDTKMWAASDSGYVPVAGAYGMLGTDGQLYVLPSDWPASPALYGTGITVPAEEMPATLEILDMGVIEVRSGQVVADITVRDLKKPASYSDLSPIADIEAGPNDERSHSSQMDWTLEGVTPPQRADMVELWRTSADQSLVFYRVEAYGKPTPDGVVIVGKDTLTDEDLFDNNRPNYAAMPVVLPNGGVNAYRFGKPRSDMAVGVAFQDRLFMAVSTSGEGVNTLYYSEFDEFESMPDINELPIQSNQKSSDVLVALVPFGSMLLAMQHTHTYSVTYNSDPGIDASIQMMSHRGTLHQRCWDLHENVLYAADESGIYSMSRNGEVTDISLPVRDYFVSELIDFSKRETFFLQADPKTHILRFFCTLHTHLTDTPSMALCYDIQARSWWTESYPNSITASCTGRPADTRLNTLLLGAVDGNMYEIDGDADEPNSSLTGSTVLTGGSGYREAPEITVPNCKGARVQGVVDEGQLVDVIIESAGWDSDYGIDILTEDGRPLTGHDDKYIQGAEYAPIKLIIGNPEPGGVVATATVDWEVMPEIRRFCTSVEGQNFVRLEGTAVQAIEPDYHSHITTESGLLIELEQGGDQTLRTQPPVVEVGMEAIGHHIPLNSYVSSINRNNIYLKHPDGTDVSLLFGLPRTEQVMQEVVVSGQTVRTKVLGTVARLTLPALNYVGQEMFDRDTVSYIPKPYTLVVDDASNIQVGSVVSGSLGVPDQVEKILTGPALNVQGQVDSNGDPIPFYLNVAESSGIEIGSAVEGNELAIEQAYTSGTVVNDNAPYTITLVDISGIQVGAKVLGVETDNNGDTGVPTDTFITSITNNVITVDKPVNIPFASATRNVLLNFSKVESGVPANTVVTAISTDGTLITTNNPVNIPRSNNETVKLRFSLPTVVTAVDINSDTGLQTLTVNRPVNIPTSSYNEVFLRFSFVSGQTALTSRYYVGTDEQLVRGGAVTGTGVSLDTKLSSVVTASHKSDPSDVSPTETVIITLDKLASLTENALLEFGYSTLDQQVDAGTTQAWLEEGGSRFLVRFVKPSKTHIPFRMQTGHMPVVNEDYVKNGDANVDRSISLVYTPTHGDKDIELLERYNAMQEPRSNSMRRSRGGSGTFEHRQDSASTVLNMNRQASGLGFATGVAKAKFASRSNADMTGTDQHLQLELYGRPNRGSSWQRTNFFVPETVKTPLPCVVHQVVVQGVVQDAE